MLLTAEIGARAVGLVVAVGRAPAVPSDVLELVVDLGPLAAPVCVLRHQVGNPLLQGGD
jgi:hypothetical protein